MCALHERDSIFNCLSSFQFLFFFSFAFNMPFDTMAEKYERTRNCDGEKKKNAKREHIYLSNVQRTPVTRAHIAFESVDRGREWVLKKVFRIVAFGSFVAAFVHTRNRAVCNVHVLQICSKWICVYKWMQRRNMWHTGVIISFWWQRRWRWQCCTTVKMH